MSEQTNGMPCPNPLCRSGIDGYNEDENMDMARDINGFMGHTVTISPRKCRTCGGTGRVNSLKHQAYKESRIARG